MCQFCSWGFNITAKCLRDEIDGSVYETFSVSARSSIARRKRVVVSIRCFTLCLMELADGAEWADCWPSSGQQDCPNMGR